jgi:DNA-binding CsgD family transcriptional regulator
MAGSAITPHTRQTRPKRQQPPLHGSAVEGLARITVGDRAFSVVAASGAGQTARGNSMTGEQARFKLCGLTFLVVEETVSDSRDDDSKDVAARLTGRELQIAILVAKGDPVKRIAYKLGITEWTVKEYLRRIFAKLGVRSQAAMVYQCAGLFRRLDQEGRLPDIAGIAASQRNQT